MLERVFSIEIATTPEQVWEALTMPKSTQQWYFGSTVESSWGAGDIITYRGPDGEPDIEGIVLAAEPPSRLRTTFHPLWSAEVAAAPDSTVEWSIERLGELSRVTITHAGMAEEEAAHEETEQGWTDLLSALKTLLESGSPVVP